MLVNYSFLNLEINSVTRCNLKLTLYKHIIDACGIIEVN